jgi:hypothetical protein
MVYFMKYILLIQFPFGLHCFLCVSYQSLSRSCHTALDYGLVPFNAPKIMSQVKCYWSIGDVYLSLAPDPNSDMFKGQCLVII